MPVYKFEVRVPIEPMSGTKGKRKYARKKELIDAITKAKGEELETARSALSGKRVSIAVEFFLWKSDATHTNTTGRKDIDNLLKIVFDALQAKVDEQGRMEGLGLIENDDSVYHVEATKRLVETPGEVGLRLTVVEHVI